MASTDESGCHHVQSVPSTRNTDRCCLRFTETLSSCAGNQTPLVTVSSVCLCTGEAEARGLSEYPASPCGPQTISSNPILHLRPCATILDFNAGTWPTTGRNALWGTPKDQGGLGQRDGEFEQRNAMYFYQWRLNLSQPPSRFWIMYPVSLASDNGS
jgi:hypothetical protein